MQSEHKYFVILDLNEKWEATWKLLIVKLDVLNDTNSWHDLDTFYKMKY